MWHYRHFTEVHDGVPYLVYTTHGAEKLKHVFEELKQNTCAFMFGMIVLMEIKSEVGYLDLPRRMRAGVAVLEINPLNLLVGDAVNNQRTGE